MQTITEEEIHDVERTNVQSYSRTKDFSIATKGCISAIGLEIFERSTREAQSINSTSLSGDSVLATCVVEEKCFSQLQGWSRFSGTAPAPWD